MIRLPRRQVQISYGIAILATLVALALRLGMGDVVRSSSPFLFFMPAIMLSAWYGGFGPGLAATIGGAIVVNYFLLEPFHNFSIGDADIGRVVLFVLIGLEISWLSGQMYSARQRAVSDATAARRSERLYRVLASNFPDGFVCLFDADFRWTLVAGAGLAAAELTREQMEGRPIAETFPPRTAAQVQRACAQAATGESYVGEITHGDRVYFCHALPLKTPDELTHVGMIILEDITERVRSREALQWAHDNLERHVQQRTAELYFQKTLLESQNHASADGILAVSNDGRVIFANRRFSEMWRLDRISEASPIDVIRKRMRQQLESSRDPLSMDYSNLGVGEENAEEMSLKGGRSVERYSAPILDPEGVSFGRVWFFHDVTESRRLQREILEAGERERQRIGRDLHDDLCQQLTGIACHARALQQSLTKRNQNPRDASAALEIVHMVQEANQRARDLAKGLQPVNLMRQGLPAALQELCDSIQSIFHVNCTFHGSDVADDLTEPATIQLYRVVQEAIHNAIRHGEASTIRIDMVSLPDRLILSIEDNGIGVPDPLPQTGLGLHTMNYRARLIGGSLTVEPTQPTGTIVTCTVPLRPPQPAITAPRRGEAAGSAPQPIADLS